MQQENMIHRPLIINMKRHEATIIQMVYIDDKTMAHSFIGQNNTLFVL